MHNQPIGVLDSGVGGLSIWKEIARELPNESTIYIADSLNCPYGAKSEEQILDLSRRLVQFLIDKHVKLIVLACNTITVSCLDKLRIEFPSVPIIGTVPVIKTAVEKTLRLRLGQAGKIGILSTTTTANSAYQKNLIKQFASNCTVINIGTDKLVPLIERGGDHASMIRIIRVDVQPFIDARIDVLALGCSHFLFIHKQIQQLLGPSVQILDSGAAIARQVRRVLTNNNTLSSTNNPSHAFFTTGDADSFKRVIRTLVGYNAEDVRHVIP